MDITAFNSLDEFEQYELLFTWGVLLLDRNEGMFSYVLYQIDGFYIEIRHDLHHNAITGLRTFITTNLLRPYLDTMEINTGELL